MIPSWNAIFLLATIIALWGHPAAQAVDSEPPNVSIVSPHSVDTVSHVTAISVVATDNSSVSNTEFFADGISIGSDQTPPFGLAWNTLPLSNSLHTLTVVATDLAGNRATSAPVQVTTLNPIFVNEVVVPDIAAATTLAFLPDRRMLVGELTEVIWVVQPGANAPDPTPFLQLDSQHIDGEQGLMDIILDPDFSENGYIYVFYTRGFPNHDNYDRVSRFTVDGNAALPESEFVVWQDDVPAVSYHHGGGMAIGPDGKLYITVGEHFDPPASQDLTMYHGKLLRVNLDGSIPPDNPFADGSGPNKDEIWALGLRNPFRISSDNVSGRMFIADVGGNDHEVGFEEINLVVRGANYGWPMCEGDCADPEVTDPLFSYAQNGRDASITGGFVYRGGQFPSEFYGSYFFADYAQNWLKRLTFDTNGALIAALDFEPSDGTMDGPYGDPVKLVEGPEGALYYIDIGFTDSHEPNEATIRRVRYSLTNQSPYVVAAATPTSGLRPLQVSFSSTGSFDPEGLPITYQWTFGDGATSTSANPSHTYQTSGSYIARLAVSDGANTTLSSNIAITVGNQPTVTILSPIDGSLFRAGDVIAFSGSATDVEDGPLAASSFSWSILFHHEGHVHPGGGPFTNTTSGTLHIPLRGHDFAGNTSYEIVVSVIDSEGLRAATSVEIFPEKVSLLFDTVPSGLALDLGGIRRTTPFVQDSLIGFNNVVYAPRQTFSGLDYQFVAWTDGGAASHTIVTPETVATFVARYDVAGAMGITPLPSGAKLKFKGRPGGVWRIEASADLKTWQTLGTASVNPEGTFEFSDTDPGHLHRFYRCVTP